MSFKQLADRAAGTITKALGEPVAIQLGSDAPVLIEGVYSDTFNEVSGDFQVVTSKPNVLVRLTDLPKKPRQGDGVLVNSQSYKISEVQDDGEATALLLLHRV